MNTCQTGYTANLAGTVQIIKHISVNQRVRGSSPCSGANIRTE